MPIPWCGHLPHQSNPIPFRCLNYWTQAQNYRRLHSINYWAQTQNHHPLFRRSSTPKWPLKNSQCTLNHTVHVIHLHPPSSESPPINETLGTSGSHNMRHWAPREAITNNWSAILGALTLPSFTILRVVLPSKVLNQPTSEDHPPI